MTTPCRNKLLSSKHSHKSLFGMNYMQLANSHNAMLELLLEVFDEANNNIIRPWSLSRRSQAHFDRLLDQREKYLKEQVKNETEPTYENTHQGN